MHLLQYILIFDNSR